MPDYTTLFEQVGVSLKRDPTNAFFGAEVDDKGRIQNNPSIGSPAYAAGMDKGDRIVFVNNTAVNENTSFSSLLQNYGPGDQIKLTFDRFGNQKSISIQLSQDPKYYINLIEKEGQTPSAAVLKNRMSWLAPK